jgi:hypothetical protein
LRYYRESSQPDPFHLILREPLLRSIVKLCRARAFVRRHFLRVFERAAIGEVSGDAGRAKRVIADRRVNANRFGAALSASAYALFEVFRIFWRN